MSSIKSFIMRRIWFSTLTFIILLILNFIIPRAMPGDPARILVNEYQLPMEAVNQLKATFNLDKSIQEQFLAYLRETLLHLNFGYSYRYYPTTVWELLMQRLPWTILLLGVASITTPAFGILLGIISGWRRGKKTDLAITSTSMFIWAIPYFWLAMVLLYLFGYLIPIFPLGHAVTPGVSHQNLFEYVVDVLRHMILPIIAITLTGYASYTLITRNAMIETLMEDYILTAEAKGLPEKKIMLNHAARNALLPTVTMVALRFGFIVSGSIYTETVFSYPGVGLLIYEAITYHDYPVLQAAFFLLSITVILANIIADIVYLIVDPRVKYT
ncbi:MAG: ABC transporter permease [Candidatus Methanomethylicia archaeon]